MKRKILIYEDDHDYYTFHNFYNITHIHEDDVKKLFCFNHSDDDYKKTSIVSEISFNTTIEHMVSINDLNFFLRDLDKLRELHIDTLLYIFDSVKQQLESKNCFNDYVKKSKERIDFFTNKYKNDISQLKKLIEEILDTEMGR